MPATHLVSLANDPDIYRVTKNGVDLTAHILERRDHEVYVHYVNTDKRLDEWISEAKCHKIPGEEPLVDNLAVGSRKRKRGPRASETPDVNVVSRPASPSFSPRGESSAPPEPNGSAAPDEVVMTEEDFDIQQHKKITAQRNFDRVIVGEWSVKTWYFSPYPLTESEADEFAVTPGTAAQSTKIPGVHKVTPRSHGRTSDLLAGGLGRAHAGERSMLWVCEMCFKYMADCNSYELHLKSCNVKHPPGRKVYQRGAHTIWEVDGAENKLYCQNLSLFGKLFIDVKTLFFDCDNFLFYILTNAKSASDHIIGYFSKEKLSYDDYNLACIMTLPPYQKQGFGMLLIEFSYELSRRSGKVGTPERPLSDLGLRSYLAYWVATLIRFFRRVLSVVPPDVTSLTCIGNFPDLLRSPSEYSEESVNGNGNNFGNGNGNSGPPRKKKRMKGWDGETGLALVPLSNMDDADPLFTTERLFTTVGMKDGTAQTHITTRCTLGDIARATNLRVEDAAFALKECGLLTKQLDDDEGATQVVLSRDLVEKVAEERNVKIPCLQLNSILLE
ncbi:acyl-CoA N-acyltransferase [Collybia nuda]|uniref:histone acetyltransferase n=1 Tax=Collybia nuda TaxID=64659 RepID=A0A9P6CHY2_9AGAR|nr:acyl-CoA N-acyltransferase [Collybia nuda]